MADRDRDYDPMRAYAKQHSLRRTKHRPMRTIIKVEQGDGEQTLHLRCLNVHQVIWRGERRYAVGDEYPCPYCNA